MSDQNQNQERERSLAFDIKRALAGDRVVTRCGDAVTGFHYFHQADIGFGQRLFGVVNGTVECWDDDGRFFYRDMGTKDSGCDLFMAERAAEQSTTDADTDTDPITAIDKALIDALETMKVFNDALKVHIEVMRRAQTIPGSGYEPMAVRLKRAQSEGKL